jgi:hypothetical protein
MMDAMPLDDGDSARVTTCSSCNETVQTNASTVKVSNVKSSSMKPREGEGQQASKLDESSPQLVAMRKDLSIRKHSLSVLFSHCVPSPFCVGFSTHLTTPLFLQ